MMTPKHWGGRSIPLTAVLIFIVLLLAFTLFLLALGFAFDVWLLAEVTG